jgi:hypothetical protein
MSEFANCLALILSALFAAAAALNLSAPGFVRRVYQRWAFPRGFYYVAGLAQLLTAAFLSVPQTRIWGGVLGVIVLFVTTVSLLNHRKYLFAFPAILVLIALAPAMA